MAEKVEDVEHFNRKNNWRCRALQTESKFKKSEKVGDVDQSNSDKIQS